MPNPTFHSLLDSSNSGCPPSCPPNVGRPGSTSYRVQSWDSINETHQTAKALLKSLSANQQSSPTPWRTLSPEQASALKPQKIPPYRPNHGSRLSPTLSRNFQPAPNSNLLTTQLSNITRCSVPPPRPRLFQSTPYNQIPRIKMSIPVAPRSNFSKEESELREDSLAMLSTVISTVMTMASRVPNVPDEYYIWTEKYLKCIKNQQGLHPANVKRILKMLSTREEVPEKECECIPLTYFASETKNK